MITPNDNLPFSIKLIPLAPSAISVAKPWCVSQGFELQQKIIGDDYCVPTHATSHHPLLPVTRPLGSLPLLNPLSL